MGKVISQSRLVKELSVMRKQHKKIVAVNGCFDIIHVGHVRYLNAAKKEGDILVAALNSDSSIRRLKGKGRPIIPQYDRAEILSAMQMVDYVVIFNETTAEKILKLISPDVHAKGTDYKKQTVPEKHLLNKYVKKIVIAGDKKRHSTKDLIKHIR